MKGELPKIIVNVGDDFFVMQVADRAASHIVVVQDATPKHTPFWPRRASGSAR
jgi:hypothetical protein